VIGRLEAMMFIYMFNATGTIATQMTYASIANTIIQLLRLSHWAIHIMV
jgi:hypothetical protein